MRNYFKINDFALRINQISHLKPSHHGPISIDANSVIRFFKVTGLFVRFACLLCEKFDFYPIHGLKILFYWYRRPVSWTYITKLKLSSFEYILDKLIKKIRAKHERESMQNWTYTNISSMNLRLVFYRRKGDNDKW